MKSKVYDYYIVKCAHVHGLGCVSNICPDFIDPLAEKCDDTSLFVNATLHKIKG